MNSKYSLIARILALPAFAAALALPSSKAQEPASPAPDFGAAADTALAAMKAKAEEQGIKGVAIVAYAPGETVTGWTSKMLVVGMLDKAPANASDKGWNYLAIAYAKAGEMASTQKDSGKRGAPPYGGEVGWQGGATAKGRTGTLFAAFSGGKGEQDYACSQAGLAVLQKSL